MDRKFIVAVVICVVALLSVSGGSIYLGRKATENKATKQSSNKVETSKSVETTTSFNQYLANQDAYNIVKDEETTVSIEEFTVAEETTKQKVVEANTESNVDTDEYLYGLSKEAAARIDELDFGADSELTMPVQGGIIMPFNMDGTVYYSTLDVYKTNPGIVIESSEGTEVKAATTGVITNIGDDDELGVYIDQAIGDGYVATYGQIVNPVVEEGDYVEAGQVIAYVNEPTKYYSVEGDNLYFAVAKDGECVDPLNFIEY